MSPDNKHDYQAATLDFSGNINVILIREAGLEERQTIDICMYESKPFGVP